MPNDSQIVADWIRKLRQGPEEYVPGQSYANMAIPGDMAPEPDPIVMDDGIEELVTKPSAVARHPAEEAMPVIAPAEAPEEQYGFGSDLNADALRSAQARAQVSNNVANFGQAGANIGRAIARLPGKADTTYWDNFRKQGQQGVEDISKLRTATTQDREYARKDEASDPNSTKAVVYRNFLAKQYKTDPGLFKDMTMAELKEFAVPSLESATRLEQLKELRKMSTESAEKNARIRAGISGGRQAQLTDKQVDAVTEFDTTIENTKAALAAMKDDYVGRVRGRLPDIAINSPEEAAFRSEVGRIADAYRKLITGAGASVQELRRLESRLPSVTDTPEIFRAKAQQFIQEVERGKGIYLSNQSKKGKNVSVFRSRATPATPGIKADPEISKYASDHGLNYERAESILMERGYGR